MPSSDRNRSRSPKHKGGLRWKQKPKGDDENNNNNNKADDSERRPRRQRSPIARKAKPEDKDNEPSSSEPAPARTSVAAKFGRAAASKHQPATKADDDDDDDRPVQTQPGANSTTAAPAAPSNEEMIVVYVNDRLGTKAAIPCLASDPVKAFKLMVAARIGRAPHEIMIKRQGERPFKDVLSLADYGVSNGVQLDLELDTGD